MLTAIAELRIINDSIKIEIKKTLKSMTVLEKNYFSHSGISSISSLSFRYE